jgi:hypothetical protein
LVDGNDTSTQINKNSSTEDRPWVMLSGGCSSGIWLPDEDLTVFKDTIKFCFPGAHPCTDDWNIAGAD